MALPAAGQPVAAAARHVAATHLAAEKMPPEVTAFREGQVAPSVVRSRVRAVPAEEAEITEDLPARDHWAPGHPARDQGAAVEMGAVAEERGRAPAATVAA